MNHTRSLDLLERGRAFEADRPRKAAKAFTGAVAADPDNEPAWTALVRVLERVGDPAHVVELQATLTNAGVNADRLDATARDLQRRRDLNEPAKFAEALRVTPDDPLVRSRIRNFAHLAADRQEFRELEDAFATLPLPTHIRIETASVCNLRCQHCTTGVAYKSTDRRVMSLPMFERVLQQLRTLPTIRTAIMYLGGEPLLNKHHATMCRRVKEESQVRTVKFVTNAMLLTQKWCDEIAAAGVESIHVSIDGRSPEENDQIRVGASYGVIRDNLRMLHRTLQEAGVRTRIVIGNAVFRRPDDLMQSSVPEFITRDFPGFKVRSGYAMVWPGMSAEDTTLDIAVYQDKPPLFCDHPFYDLGIRANGDVVLCCYDISGKHVMGNVMTDELLELYQSEPYVAIRRAMLHHDGAAVPAICQRCVNFTGDRFLQNPMRT